MMLALALAGATHSQIAPPEAVSVKCDPGGAVRVQLGPRDAFTSPPEGLWSIALGWKDGWPTDWRHALPDRVVRSGDWTLATGSIDTGRGTLKLRDAYRMEKGRVRCVRRFEWSGKETLTTVTLSCRWVVVGLGPSRPLLPGISYSGNPSGASTKSCVPIQSMKVGEESIYEEHRFPMPFVSLEGKNHGAAMHTVPSMPSGANKADQWWSLGLVAGRDSVELLSLSGPVASNGRRSVVKARQDRFMDYSDTWLNLKPGMIVEKTFFLEPYSVSRPGTGFYRPMSSSLELFQPYSVEGLPSYRDILEAKMRFADSRWREGDSPGYEMYPDFVEGTHYVMGWCGQAEALGYALLALEKRFPGQRRRAQASLDVLARAPIDEGGFYQRFTAETGKWTEQDFVSQGQAMESFSRAVGLGRKKGLATKQWEQFLRRAAAFHASRILSKDWRPLSTNEGFLVSPLLRCAQIFDMPELRRAALKAADHYRARHLDLREPYWGGTLDARCEDKEGAWAAFQAFLACFDATGEKDYLTAAEHAMNVALTYTMVWDVDLPPGRLKDHGFKSRGWTVVSAQNQHLDVFGVFYAPEVYRMGQILKQPHLKKLARVMFRSCGQLIDPAGSQGEQIQHTNFAQAGDMSDVYRLRGGYSEGWTVFWITTHFLHAAGRFEEIGVDLDDDRHFR